MKTDNYLALCLEQAANSNLRYRHGCIVVRGGKVIGEGFNESRSGFDGGALKTGFIAAGPPKSKCKSSSKIPEELSNDVEATKNAPHKGLTLFENMGGGHNINTPFTMHSEMMAIRSALSTSSTLAATVRSSKKPYFKLPGLSKQDKRLRREALKAYVSHICSEGNAAITEQSTVERRRDLAQVQQRQFESATSQSGGYGGEGEQQERRGEDTYSLHDHQKTSHHCHHQHHQQSQYHHQYHDQKHQHGQHGQKGSQQNRKSLSRPKKDETYQPQAFLQPYARTEHPPYSIAERRRFNRLNGVDLYVARLGNHSENERKQSKRPLEEAEPAAQPIELDRSLVKSEKIASMGSLHEELEFPDPRIPSRSPPKERELFDCSMIRASKPCYRCVEYMRSVGIKRVFWTDETGQWKGCKVHELCDSFDKLSTSRHADEIAGSGPFVTKHEVLMLRRRMGN
ncbi:hypothetical protein EV356DRAFT_565269 [Viridothelium virens]|uniref:Uncharacterized protein n=1 Tax=Viridothelium virens TaxID=1048519 RepID=A0A6A6HFX8_VIRVR|nr:hypothetical protein EV356DRAFT_565269 [Viridothelium virens]